MFPLLRSPIFRHRLPDPTSRLWNLRNCRRAMRRRASLRRFPRMCRSSFRQAPNSIRQTGHRRRGPRRHGRSSDCGDKKGRLPAAIDNILFKGKFGGGGSPVRTGLPCPFAALREICREIAESIREELYAISRRCPQHLDTPFVKIFFVPGTCAIPEARVELP